MALLDRRPRRYLGAARAGAKPGFALRNWSIMRIHLQPLVVATCASALTLVGAGATFGQEIDGALVDEATGQGIEGAFVIALDSARTALAGSLTDARGRFRIRLPEAGTVTLLAQRIGYESTESERLQVGLGEIVPYRLAVFTQAVVLTGLDVTVTRRCALVENAGLALERIWQEARKAMTVAEWTRSSGVVEMQIADIERVRHAQTLEILTEARTLRPYYGARPYESLAAEELARAGYVVARSDGTYYYAPDESVLLSDSFLQSHCFQAVRDPERPGLIGLAFEPTADVAHPDIRGSFWLDEQTAELRVLEYNYTRVLERVAAPEAGGRVEFRRLDSGAWIVANWTIRMPQIAVVAEPGRQVSVRDPRVVTQYLETGGEVIQVLDPRDRRARERAMIEGRVVERDTGAPLVGAVVFLSGTQYRTVTDGQGRFRLEGLPEGRFPLVYRHRWLEDLGTFAPPLPVELQAGRRLEVTLYFPPVPPESSEADDGSPEARSGGR